MLKEAYWDVVNYIRSRPTSNFGCLHQTGKMSAIKLEAGLQRKL